MYIVVGVIVQYASSFEGGSSVLYHCIVSSAIDN